VEEEWSEKNRTVVLSKYSSDPPKEQRHGSGDRGGVSRYEGSAVGVRKINPQHPVGDREGQLGKRRQESGSDPATFTDSPGSILRRKELIKQF